MINKYATSEDMIKMINVLEDNERGWIGRTIWHGPLRFPESLEKSILWNALHYAESLGESYNSTVVLKDEPGEHTEVGCAVWLVCTYGRYYRVSYITDDAEFNAESLDEYADMDRLIIQGPFRIV